MAVLNFDSTNVAPAASLDPIPSGWYNCNMVASEMKPTSDGTGAFLECEYVVLDGQYVGRKVFDRLNLNNKNPIAVEIAYKTLSAICHATGVIQVADSSQLHMRPMQVKVALKPARTADDGKQYDANNEVKGYKALEVGGQQAPMQQAPQQFTPPPQQQQAAPQQQPWQQQPAPQQVPMQQQPPAWNAQPQQAAPQQQPWQQQPAPAQQMPPQQAAPQQAPVGQPPTPPWQNQAPQQQQPPMQQAPQQQAGPTPPWAPQQ